MVKANAMKIKNKTKDLRIGRELKKMDIILGWYDHVLNK